MISESKPSSNTRQTAQAAVNVLVDDRVENLITLETVLRTGEDNTHYILCRSGEEALKIAIKEEIALILLDVQMPGMDGFEVARLLKNNSRTNSIPIIFVTAIDHDQSKVMQGFESGAVDFLFKPLNPSITRAKVKAFIKIHWQNKELQQKNQLLKEKQQIIEETHVLAGIGTWEWELATERMNWSQTLYDIFGFDKSSPPDFSQIINAVYQEDQNKVKALIERALRSAEPVWGEYRIWSNGKVLYVIGNTQCKRNEAGEPVKLKGYLQDITALKESQNLVERILDASLNAIWSLKALRNAAGQIEDFEIVRVNQATERIVKLNLVNLAGKRLTQEFPRLKQGGIFSQYVQVVETGIPINNEQPLVFDGVETWFAQQAVKLEDGLVVTFEDISRRKRAEEDLLQAHNDLLGLNNKLEERVKTRTKDLMKTEGELRETNTHLRRINADLDNFIYTASHDLKAPINNIEGLSAILKKRLPPENESIRELVKMMDDSIEKFKNTLSDLTEVSKLEHAEFGEPEEVDIAALVEEVKLNINELIHSNQAEIVLQLDISNVQFSRKNLRSILYNLLSNSIKYRSPDRNPQVSIRTFYDPLKEYKILVVKDNGLGISQEDVPKMFGMFKRLHSHVEGTGIGLYIVKRIVENMGGKIEVESQLGQGTEFRIYVPAA